MNSAQVRVKSLTRRNTIFVTMTLLSSIALAQGQQNARAPVLEEVVVTAQKRAESVQDVPISMVVFGRDDLSNQRITDAPDIFNNAPNLSAVQHQATQYNFFIRGVGTFDFHLNTISAVGVYLDEVSINSPFAAGFSLYDMERVEILRGPQNTLFGRNTTGGAVNYITRQPVLGDSLHGYLDATVGRFNERTIEGAVGFPMGSNMAGRVSLKSEERDGAFHNVTTGKNLFDRNRYSGRAQLLWQPVDDLEVWFKVHGGTDRSNGVPPLSFGLLDPSDLTSRCPVPDSALTVENNPFCADASGFVPQRSDFNEVFTGTEATDDVDVWGASARLDWDISDSVSLTSVTAFDSTEIRHNDDTDGAPTVIFEFYQDGNLEQWSQDLRLTSSEASSLRWMLGAFYFLEQADYITAVRRTPDPTAPSGPGEFNILPSTIVQQDDEVYSAYAQLDYDLTPDLTSTLGYRYSAETKDGRNTSSVRGTGGFLGPAVPEGVFLDAATIEAAPVLLAPFTDLLDKTFNEWGMRFALNYRATENARLYGSVSRGVKAGGFSLAAQQSLTGLGSQPVESEILWAYEVGIKAELFDRSLRVSAATFYYDWKNRQSFQTLFDPAVGFGVSQLLNIPAASMVGGELEAVWALPGDWLVRGALGVMNAEIDDPGFVVGVSKGNQLPSSPDLTFNGVIRKEILTAAGDFALQTDFRYQDEISYDLTNALYMAQEGYWLLNARASYAFGNERNYEVSIWGDNLTDSEYCNYLSDFRGLSESAKCLPNIGKPTYGLSFRLRFE